MRKVKIYEVKSDASTNAEKLLSEDNIFFYWNDRKFALNNVNDVVFIVNRRSKWVCFIKISIKTIQAIHDKVSKTSSFNNSGKTYTVSDPKEEYNVFIQFTILDKREMPDNWNWTKQLGQSETFDLVKEGIMGQVDRISKIYDLKKVFKDGDALKVLNDAENFILNGKEVLNSSRQLPVTTKTTRIFEMNILTAIKTKPFIILAGMSGTGKSRLIRTLAFNTCSKVELRKDLTKPGNFEMIPVRPNWYDSSELMGYISRINGEKYITTSFLKFIAKAWKYLDVPFFLCLDEMNLAPVEQYFAEYLSIIETRQTQNNEIVTDYLISKDSFENPELYKKLLIDLELSDNLNVIEGIRIPKNIVVIGTVNMDETTHSFSRKVLDRAMTFEMNKVDLNVGLNSSNSNWSYPETFISSDEVLGIFTSGAEVYAKFPESKNVIDFLEKINLALEGTPFKIAYRVRDEFLIYCYYSSLKQNSSWLAVALDEITTMKILSKIEGDEMKVGKAIQELIKILTKDTYPQSHNKLVEMHKNLQYGYTSFWS